MRLLLAACLLGLACAGTAAASEEHPTAAELESELVCPVCDSTLDTSNAEIARRMKVRIRERIAAGATKSEIKAEFVEQFGERVLAEPPKRGFDLLAWVLPLVGGALALVAVATVARGWRRAGAAAEAQPTDVPLDPGLERRLDDELDRYE
ncbi:MAG TPA: cytochrome c-type biogenesis protein [Gaiellaceae bacterium]|jgi:cytochrome c-type biogenesis protein CcmH|nr:cytochrome c-type biogenesis protein [Gaiellaceae bacterium]